MILPDFLSFCVGLKNQTALPKVLMKGLRTESDLSGKKTALPKVMNHLFVSRKSLFEGRFQQLPLRVNASNYLPNPFCDPSKIFHQHFWQSRRKTEIPVIFFGVSGFPLDFGGNGTIFSQ